MENFNPNPQIKKNLSDFSEKNNLVDFRFRCPEFKKKFRRLQKHFISIHIHYSDKECTLFFFNRGIVHEFPVDITDDNIAEFVVLDNFLRFGSGSVFKDEVVYIYLKKYYNLCLNCYYGNKH